MRRSYITLYRLTCLIMFSTSIDVSFGLGDIIIEGAGEETRASLNFDDREDDV